MPWYKKDGRAEELRACANALNWAFKPKDESGMIKWLLDFNLFKHGGGRKIEPLIITREDDLAFTCMFDYTYTISTGKSTATFHQTVYFRYSKALALPHFVMVPEKWYHRVGLHSLQSQALPVVLMQFLYLNYCQLPLYKYHRIGYYHLHTILFQFQR